MLLPVLSLLLQTPGAVPGAQPVRVWLEPAGLVVPGERMSVFVTTARDGHVLALRVTSDRRIEIVFPSHPDDGTFVEAGSYELRGPDDAQAFVVTEPPGAGIVIAALASTPFDFHEFVVGGAWNDNALTAVLTGGDAVGALLDITQRMLGPEYFNYDMVTYTVTPRAHAPPVVVVTSLVPYPVCYGWGCGFFPVRPLPRPCLLRHDDCEAVRFCGAAGTRLSHRIGCEFPCRLGGCSDVRRGRALALYRESRPIGRAAPVAAAEAPQPRERPRPIEPRDRRPSAAPVAAAPRRPVPISGGKRAMTPAPRDARARTKARVTAPLPERVPWPRAATPAAVQPVPRTHAAAGKQTGARPALPQRIDWPAASTPARGKTPPRATAVAPARRVTGTTVWSGVSVRPIRAVPAAAPSARDVAGARAAASRPRGAVAPGRSTPARAGARSDKAGTRAKP